MCIHCVIIWPEIITPYTHLELRQWTQDSYSSHICDKGREPAQINITYSKKLQDNIGGEKEKKENSLIGRDGEKSVRGNSLVQRQQCTTRQGPKLKSNRKIYSAEKAPGGMGRDKKEERDDKQRRFKRDGTDFIPYEYPKDSEMEQHFALIWSAALTAAQAWRGIMFYSPL